jgi:hypothetical protein
VTMTTGGSLSLHKFKKVCSENGEMVRQVEFILQLRVKFLHGRSIVVMVHVIVLTLETNAEVLPFASLSYSSMPQPV